MIDDQKLSTWWRVMVTAILLMMLLGNFFNALSVRALQRRIAELERVKAWNQ